MTAPANVKMATTAPKIAVPPQDPDRPSKKVHKPEDLQKWLSSQVRLD